MVFEGLWLRKLSAVVSDGPNSYLLISAFSLLRVSQKHLLSSACKPQLQETAMLSFRSIDCDFRKDLCCHPAHRHFTDSHVTPRVPHSDIAPLELKTWTLQGKSILNKLNFIRMRSYIICKNKYLTHNIFILTTTINHFYIIMLFSMFIFSYI